MSKINPQTIQNLQNEASAVSKINANFAEIRAVIDNLLSRDGTAPNQMVALLDMNNRKIINLPIPTTPNEPARHGDIQQYVDQAHSWADVSHGWADASEASAEDAQESEDQALAYLTDFLSRYVGAYPTPPEVDGMGNPLVEGALYWNTFTDTFFSWAVREVYVDDELIFVGDQYVTVQEWQTVHTNRLAGLADVGIVLITNGQLLQWNSSLEKFVPFTLDAASVPYSGTLESTNIADALDEIEERTLFDRYDISFYAQGLIAETEILFRLVTRRPFTLPADTSQYVSSASSPSAGTASFSLQKNGVQFGTLTFTSSDEGVFSIPGDTSFAAGDVLSVVAAATVDTNLRDVTMTLAGVR